MKKTYEAPRASEIRLETDEILAVSGNFLLENAEDSTASKSPAKDFGNISLW